MRLTNLGRPLLRVPGDQNRHRSFEAADAGIPRICTDAKEQAIETPGPTAQKGRPIGSFRVEPICSFAHGLAVSAVAFALTSR